MGTSTDDKAPCLHKVVTRSSLFSTQRVSHESMWCIQCSMAEFLWPHATLMHTSTLSPHDQVFSCDKRLWVKFCLQLVEIVTLRVYFTEGGSGFMFWGTCPGTCSGTCLVGTCLGTCCSTCLSTCSSKCQSTCSGPCLTSTCPGTFPSTAQANDTLPIGARCCDDLAAAHYRLAHAVAMT